MTRKYTGYSAKLTKDAQILWTKGFSVLAKREKSNKKSIKIGTDALRKATIAIKTFSIKKSGEYALDINQKGDNDVVVANLDVNIRRNVIIPNMAIALPGCVSVFLAFLGFLIFAKKLKDKKGSK